jgi:hypothetical protein
LKDAFDKPFYNGVVTSRQSQGKGKDRADIPLKQSVLARGPPGSMTQSAPSKDASETESASADRQGSPDWDIELDLNSDLEEADNSPVIKRPAKRSRINSDDGGSD